MLKKFAVLCAFLSLSMLIIFSNCMFLGEKVSAVKSGKSSGVIEEILNFPFNDFLGTYKQFSVDYKYSSLLKKYRAKLIFIEEIDGVKNYYYYSNKLPNFEVIKNKKINLQFAIASDRVVVGTPIIYGSY